MTSEPYRLRSASWAQDRQAIKSVRLAVFVVEQGVPETEEWDDKDAVSEHVLALDQNGAPIATGRLAPDGKIGRMAVLKPWRGHGLGTAVLGALLQSARRTFPDCYVYAQIHALGFYTRHGFVAEGLEFVEAGIPHRRMRLRF